VYKLSIN